MGIIVDSQRLRPELVRRELTASQLAHEARISPATVSASLGMPIAAMSLGLIADVLGRIPTIPETEALIGERRGV